MNILSDKISCIDRFHLVNIGAALDLRLKVPLYLISCETPKFIVSEIPLIEQPENYIIYTNMLDYNTVLNQSLGSDPQLHPIGLK